MEVIKPSKQIIIASITLSVVMLVFFLFPQELFSQRVSALIYVDKTNKNTDTIDFGVAFYEDNAVSKNVVLLRTVYIENTGEVPLSIPLISVPYFSTGARIANSFEHLEFSNSPNAPKIILPGAIDSFFVQYKPERDTTVTNSPIGIRVATVLVRPCPIPNGTCETVDTIGLPIRREFVAKVFKTRYPFSSFKPKFFFDSVYVNSFGSLKTRIPYKNLSRKTIGINSQVLQTLGTTLPQEFTFEPSTRLSVSPNDTIAFLSRYIPKNRGVDSALLIVRYAPGRNEVSDSASMRIYGFGAQQEVSIVSVQASLPGTTISRDTIFLRDVPVGSDNEFTVTFENTGNTNWGILSQNIVGDNQFTLVNPLPSQKDIRPNGQVSATLKFSPRSESDLGLYEAQYIIQNNIHLRIPSSPDSVKRTIITVRATALAPIMSIVGTQQDTIRFGTFRLPYNKSCGLQFVEDTISIQNIGNAELRIQTPILSGKINTKFSLRNAEADTIPKQKSKSLLIRFYPEIQGTDTAYIELQSNDPFRRKKILTLIANVTPPDTVKLSAPTFSSVDGVTVSVPLFCRSAAISQAGKVRANLTIDESDISFVRGKAWGASIGGKVIPQRLQDGVIALQVESALGGTFAPNDTLCLLEFKTYFGRLEPSPIVLTSPVIGTVECDELLVPQLTSGSFTLDSACIFAYNHITRSSSRFAIREITPVPTVSSSRISIELAFPSLTTLSIYSATGILMKTIISTYLPDGKHTFTVELDDLPHGVYYCDLKAGLFHQLRSFVIGQ